MTQSQPVPFRIRPLEERHHPGVAALLDEARIDLSDALPFWPGWMASSDRVFLVVEAPGAGHVIGYAGIVGQGPGRFRMELAVAPESRRQGIGGALLETMIREAEARGGKRLQGRSRDTMPGSLEFLTDRGFRETNRMVHLRLEVVEAIRPPESDWNSRLPGIRFTTLENEIARGAGPSQSIRDLLQRAAFGRANPYRYPEEIETLKPTSMSSVEAYMADYDPVSPSAFWIAALNDRYIGLSFFQKPGTDGLLFQRETAVDPQHRRKGIASALKWRTTEWARLNGYPTIRTNTASAGMLALNERLGFRREWADIRMVRSIGAIA